jgi:protein kinase A
MGNCSSSSSVHSPSKGTILSQNQINIQSNAYLEQAKYEFDIKYAEPLNKTAKLEDFQLQRTIGTGSFARVMLVKHGNQSLALKIMEKKSIVELNQVQHILSEKRILQAINSPFIVNLIYAFKDNAYLYLALEFVSGGEMFSSLR